MNRTESPVRIRILLADDHAILRLGLKTLLGAEPDMVVVGEAEDGRAAIEKAQALKPDVVVMDIAMPNLNGLEATREIKKLGLECQIVILTVHAQERYLFPVLQAGASGYVLKNAADTELVQAIRTIACGQVFLYPTATKLLLEDYMKRIHAGEERERYDGLTDRERAVVRLVAEGYTSQEIAEKLVISAKTVETYRARVMEKLNLQHRSELVKYALRVGLITPFDEV